MSDNVDGFGGTLRASHQRTNRENGNGVSQDDKKKENGELAGLVLTVTRELLAELRAGAVVAVSLNSALDRDLGLDSLARVELLARLERRVGCSLPEGVFGDVLTLNDVVQALAHAAPMRATVQAVSPSVVPLAITEDVPSAATTLVEILQWHVERHPERPHICLYDDSGPATNITFVQLWQQAQRIAGALQVRGVKPGEVVALMLPTSAEYFFCFFGIILAGAVPAPLYPPAGRSYLGDHLRRHYAILSNCAAGTLITVPEAERFAVLLKASVPSLRHVITADALLRNNETAELKLPQRNELCFIQYTSGSTGDPKGVMLSHDNVLANVRAMGSVVKAGSQDVFVSWLPLYHDMGLIGAWFGSLYYASLFVVMSPLAFIARPQRWLQAMHRYGGTLSAAPNFAYDLCVSRIADEDLVGLDLARWRCAFNGAEPVNSATLERFCHRFASYGFKPSAMMPVYGLAENTVGLAFPPIGRGAVVKRIARDGLMRRAQAIPAADNDATALTMISCGRPLPQHEIRIVDDNERELPEHAEGRIQFRGPSSTSGYYRNSTASARLFHGEWLDTGDRGFLDGGEIYISGRSKDLIIRAGRNIYPQELEDAVSAIEGVRRGRVAVFGSVDRASGLEHLIVMAETRLKEQAALSQVRERINTLAMELVGTAPDDVVLVASNTILKTSSGKIRRSACQELYEKGGARKKPRPLWLQTAQFIAVNLWHKLARRGRDVSAAVFAGYAWSMFFLLAVPVWLLVVLLPRATLRWSVAVVGARLLSRLTRTRIVMRGAALASIPPSCVMVVNHASYIDGLVVVAALPGPFRFVAKAELQSNWIARLFLEHMGAQFVERFSAEQSVADAQRIANVARSGYRLLYFPEGTFTRAEGLLSFRLGAFAAAAAAEVPVIPVTIHGTRSILRDGSWFPRRGMITITVGDPIPVPEGDAQNSSDVFRRAVALRDAARATILKELGEPDLG